MLKHFLIGTLTVSSLALAYPPVHGATPLAPPPPPRQMPVAAPPPPVNAIRFDDTRRANVLLRSFDDAMARHDVRAMRSVDAQFGAFLQSELREARVQRGNRNVVYRLTRIESELARLGNRMNPRTLNAKRDLYVELTQLADAHPNRRY